MIFEISYDRERDSSRILEFKESEVNSVGSSVFVESLVSLSSETYVGHLEKEDSEDVVGLGNNKYLYVLEICVYFLYFF